MNIASFRSRSDESNAPGVHSQIPISTSPVRNAQSEVSASPGRSGSIGPVGSSGVSRIDGVYIAPECGTAASAR